MIDTGTALQRRLERYRTAVRAIPVGLIDAEPRRPTETAAEIAERLAAATDGEVVASREGIVVRCEAPTRAVPVDRERLAALPGQPPPGVPLVCLDTETTGLATAAGTVAFLVGLGWWETDRFRQVQFLLPDHCEERALLSAVAAAIPPDAWLVTYNGRGFDWPLLVTRYRMARRPAPPLAGHLDLLPIVRRLFRHRMADARLRTAEAELLGLHRVGDVEGWQIPGHYLGVLRGGPADVLVEVVRHNDQDVRSLAWLLAHLATGLGDERGRAEAPAGDLAGLSRAFAREHRLGEALACLETVTTRGAWTEVVRPVAPEDWSETESPGPTATAAAAETTERRAPRARGRDDEPWWSPRRPADFGGRPTARPSAVSAARTAAFDAPWTTERIAIDRAHLLRRLGRFRDAADAWDALASGPGRTAILASIELAKLHEHRLRDPASAVAATVRGLGHVERRRRLGRPEPALETDLLRRLDRLRRRTRQVATRTADRRAGAVA